jgi:uncharacterized protein (DUF1501 family)
LKPANQSSRRSFLNIGAGAAAAIGLSEVLAPVSLAASPNRAVVCIYLIGGNDSNNMIVPMDSLAYDTYARGRGSLALAKDSLLPAKGISGSYGFHPNLPGLRDLYNQNAVAVIANVGRVAPDHRIAGDASDFSREMQVRYLQDGYVTMPWAVPESADATNRQAMPLAHGVSLATPDSNAARRRSLAGAVSGAPAADRLPDTGLGQKLSTVLATLRGGEFRRQAFLVPMDGFETRGNQMARQAALFAELDEALVGFYRGVADLGMSESVTIYTDTEFNRTLAPNKSGGSDHAWGGHQLVMGGSTLGGQIYGKFPSLAIAGADDAVGNGTWRPSISSAQYAATLAYWYGKTDLADVPEYVAFYNSSQRRLDFLTQ